MIRCVGHCIDRPAGLHRRPIHASSWCEPYRRARLPGTCCAGPVLPRDGDGVASRRRACSRGPRALWRAAGLCRARRVRDGAGRRPARVAPPTTGGDFRSIRRFAEGEHSIIVSWQVLPGAAGHYAAHRDPAALATDIRAFVTRAFVKGSTHGLTGAYHVARSAAPRRCRRSCRPARGPHPVLAVDDRAGTAARRFRSARVASFVGSSPLPSNDPFMPRRQLDGTVDDLIGPAIEAARTA